MWLPSAILMSPMRPVRASLSSLQAEDARALPRLPAALAVEDERAGVLLGLGGLVRVAGAADAAPGRQVELVGAVVPVAGVDRVVVARLAHAQPVPGVRGRVGAALGPISARPTVVPAATASTVSPARTRRGRTRRERRGLSGSAGVWSFCSGHPSKKALGVCSRGACQASFPERLSGLTGNNRHTSPTNKQARTAWHRRILLVTC